MFEKEAEEYVSNNVIGHKYISKAFQDGAEFGYNKAFVEADKNLKAVVADFNKANEWHYDSNVPKDRAVLICLLVTPKKEADMKPYLIYRTSVSDGGFIKLFGETVYAWRDFEKVLLPKESE